MKINPLQGARQNTEFRISKFAFLLVLAIYEIKCPSSFLLFIGIGPK
jgi:hypothetical protein